jgi:DNA repair ATPase RecN
MNRPIWPRWKARSRGARRLPEAGGQAIDRAPESGYGNGFWRSAKSCSQLALSSGRFEVALLPVDGGALYGLEQVEFRIGGLAGSEAKPLAKVASGGELSRISLAIQVLTSRSASVPTLIFDEVDVGIGGGVAEIVGRLLRELGGERQVLCVTHLPQVAAQAELAMAGQQGNDATA